MSQNSNLYMRDPYQRHLAHQHGFFTGGDNESSYGRHLKRQHSFFTGADADPMGGAGALPFHLGRGGLPAHESGLDCKVRIWLEGELVHGAARCETSYGPVTLTAVASLAVLRNFAATARAVREALLKQVTALPTESTSGAVGRIASLREGLLHRDRACALRVRALQKLAAAGDARAAAFMAMLYAAAPAGGGAPTFGAAYMPFYNRAPIAVPGAPPAMHPHHRHHLRAMLQDAVRDIPPSRML